MSTPPSKATRTLPDFARILGELSRGGAAFTVIGGAAVSAYANLLGEEVRSVDLDVLLMPGELRQILTWAPRPGVTVEKLPQPRSIPVAFLNWDGIEVNLLTDAAKLGDHQAVLDRSRSFEIEGADLEIPVADPTDLIRNKRAANRQKDQPHLEVLRRFCREEIVAAFSEETVPVLRLQPARRWLDAEELDRLPADLFARILGQPLVASDLPFLAHRAPDEPGLEAVLAVARRLGDAAALTKVERVAAAKRQGQLD